MQNYCCSSFSAMLDLECFCEAKTQATSKSVLSAVVLEGIDLACGVAAAEKISDYCNPKGAASSTTKSTLPAQMDIDMRPVLDLSRIADSVSTLFGETKDQDLTLTYLEATDSHGETSYSLDVDVPDNLDLDLEVEFSEGALTDSEVTVSVSGLNEASIRGESVTIELSSGDSDRVYTAASLPNGAVVDELLVDFSNTINGLGLPQMPKGASVDLSESTRRSERPSNLDFEVNLSLPGGLLGQFQGKDVSIDLEYSLADGATFNSAEIIVEDGTHEESFDGRAIGNLMKDAARYMSATLSIPMQAYEEDVQLSVLDRKETLLGGALQFLAEIGEDISTSIPDRQLHDGDYIEIQRQNEGLAGLGEPAKRLALTQATTDRRSLDRLSEAIQSTKVEEPQQEAAWGPCTICELVDRYLYVLWGIVAGGVAVLGYYVVAAVLRSSSGAPTDPNEELTQPLIVYAADYASEGSKDALLLPIWSPFKHLQE